MANLPPVFFAAGITYTGGKFATGVLTTPVAAANLPRRQLNLLPIGVQTKTLLIKDFFHLPPVSMHFDLPISPRILRKNLKQSLGDTQESGP